MQKQGVSAERDVPIVLHGYWRSSAAYRVRIALNLKRVKYRQVTHDLRRAEQRRPDYMALSPQGLVPALQVGASVLIQSPAILEWLDERYPDPPLLPADADERAVVRSIAALIGCDIHPLNNLRALTALRGSFGADEDKVNDWVARWICDGFAALEQLVRSHGGSFAFGDAPTLADCYIVPQVFSAKRFKVDLADFPALARVCWNAEELPAVRDAHPSCQPDAD